MLLRLAGVGLAAALISSLGVTGAAAMSAGGPGYTLVTAGSAVPRWDPCTTIRYQVNSGLAAPGAVADVRQAVARLHAASGLRFAYAGHTTRVPTGRVGERYPGGVDLVIAWTTPARSRLLDGAEAGRGGGWWSTGYRDVAGQPALERRVGYVVLDATRNRSFAPGFAAGHRPSRGMLLLHEFGHAVGLAHTSDRSDVMYPILSDRAARYGAGDVAGLRLLGAPAGCLRPR